MAEAEKTTKKKGWWDGLSDTAKYAIYILTGGVFIYLIYWLFFSGKKISYEWKDGASYNKNVFAVRASDGTFSAKKGDKVKTKADSDATDNIKATDGTHEVLDVLEDGKVLVLEGTFYAKSDQKGNGTLS